MIEIDIRHRQGTFGLDVSIQSMSRLTAIFGASGSGKTSVLNVVAGLIAPQSGRVVVDGRTLLDTEGGVRLAPHRRRVGYVFQEARLFPHLTVRRNLLYGRFFTRRAERFGSLDEVVSLLGLDHLLQRRPSSLSGGERQRVAIGRALLASPRLLLMDEPLASLDDDRKNETMPYLERLRDELKVPILYVSHSRAEVDRLAGSIIMLDNGRMVERESGLKPVTAAINVRA